MKTTIRSIFILIFLGLVAVNVSANEVKIKSNGLTLNAFLVMADGKKLSDGVVLMTHGTLAHGQMEIITTLQDALKENGMNSLAISLSLGLDNRHGMYDCATPHTHKHDDAVDEIGLWLDWLKKKGAKDITLLGHSRGGNQTAWFAEVRDDSSIKAVALIAPGSFSEEFMSVYHKKLYGKESANIMNKARALVKSGKGSTMMKNTDFVYCKNTSVSAEAFVSYYESNPHLDTVKVLTRIKKPVMVFVGSEDKVVVNLEKMFAPVVDGKKIQMTVIDGADHFFRDLNSEEIVEIMLDWLKTI